VSLPADPSRALAEPMPAIVVSRRQRNWSSRTRISADQTQRYSQFVTLAKRGLLIAAGVLIAAVLVYSLQPRQRQQFTMSFQRLGIVNNDLAMIKPRLTGVNEEGDPYVVTAAEAIQDHADAQRAQLANIEADVTLKDGSWVGATAPHGLLNAAARTLVLTGAVAIYSDKGYEAHTTAAHVDMGTGMIVGSKAVAGQGPLGNFRADRFKIDRDNSVVYLYGNVRMIVYGHGLRGR
jgi:lipopolysaccharide export system protein LptC